MNNEFSVPFRVYIEDTDAGGIVYYVNYLKFMERARTEFLRSLGLPKPALLEGGMLLVIASANVEYKRSAKLDDVLNVSAKIVKRAKSYLVFEQHVFLDNQCLCTGQIKVACVKSDTLRPCPFPEAVVSALANLKEA